VGGFQTAQVGLELLEAFIGGRHFTTPAKLEAACGIGPES